MSDVTHTCAWCDQEFPCLSFVEGEDEMGHARWTCDCPSHDECPDCDPALWGRAPDEDADGEC